MMPFEERSDTINRRHGKDEPFEAWVRREPSLDGKSQNISRTDLDVMWSRWSNWMLIEKKYPNGRLSKSQEIMFRTLDSVARKDENYFGFHLLIIDPKFPFGEITLDSRKITLEQLKRFLRWEAPKDWYLTTVFT